MYCTVHIIKLMFGWMAKVFYQNGLSDSNAVVKYNFLLNAYSISRREVANN